MKGDSRLLRGLWLALLGLLAIFPVFGQNISLTGSWALSVTSGSTFLPSGPGSDFSNPQNSADNQVSINIFNPSGNSLWRVYVYKIDTNWDTALTLSVVRTGDGTGTGAVPTGGTEPGVVVPTGYANRLEFFSGRRARSGIPIRLRIEGLSVTLGAPTTYTTTVYYTVN